MRRQNFPKKESKYSEVFITEILRSDGHLPINKKFMQIFGLVSAAILSNYIDKYGYFKNKNPENEGWFFLTHDEIQNQLGIGEYSITNTKSMLKSSGIIQTKMIGIPPKEWISIDFDKIAEIFINSQENYLSKSRELPLEIKRITSRNQENIKDNIYKENKSKDNKTLSNERDVHSPKKERNIIPPTLEMIKNYCTQKKYEIDPEAFFDHFEARGWIPKGYTRQMKDWQAAVRTWKRYESAYSNNSSQKSTLSKYRKPSNGYMPSDHPNDYFSPLSTTKISNTKN